MLEDKKYKIGEVAKILNINTSAIRYYEKEFPELTPQKSSGNQRYYTLENIYFLKKIRYLVEEEGLTLEGVKKQLADTEKMKSKLFITKQELTSDLSEIIKVLEKYSTGKDDDE